VLRAFGVEVLGTLAEVLNGQGEAVFGTVTISAIPWSSQRLGEGLATSSG